ATGVFEALAQTFLSSQSYSGGSVAEAAVLKGETTDRKRTGKTSQRNVLRIINFRLMGAAAASLAASYHGPVFTKRAKRLIFLRQFVQHGSRMVPSESLAKL